MDWNDLGGWWLTELASDPAYEDDVTPMVLDLLASRGRILDVGCGEGRVMKALEQHGATAIGVDISVELLKSAVAHGPVVRMALPDLTPFRADSFDAAVISLVLEHLPDHRRLFAELSRVVSSGGDLVLVANHPIYTAQESAPIAEPDGEVLWRPGRYFDLGYTDEPAGDQVVRFHHRPLGELLTSASEAGWDLRRMKETGVTESQIRRHPPLEEQRHIPRLLGVQWTRR